MYNKCTYIYVQTFPPHLQEPVVKHLSAHHWLNEIYSVHSSDTFMLHSSGSMETRERGTNHPPVKIPSPNQACPSPSKTGNKNGCKLPLTACQRMYLTEPYETANILPSWPTKMVQLSMSKSGHCSNFWDIIRMEPTQVSINRAQVK